MWNGHLRLFAANTYLDNKEENQSLLSAEIMCRPSARGNSHTVYQGETSVANKAGVCIQNCFAYGRLCYTPNFEKSWGHIASGLSVRSFIMLSGA